MATEDEIDPQTIRRRLRSLSTAAPVQYQVFLQYCLLFDPATDVLPKGKLVQDSLKMGQSSVSDGFKGASKALGIPYEERVPPKDQKPEDAWSNVHAERRARMLAQYREVALADKLIVLPDKESNEEPGIKKIGDNVAKGPRPVRSGIPISLPLILAGLLVAAAGGFFLRQRLEPSPASIPLPTQTARVERIELSPVVVVTIIRETSEPLPTNTPYPTFTPLPTPAPVVIERTVPPIVVTATPLPATATPEISPTPEPPTPTATPKIQLRLPFEDNFDNGRRPEWHLISGDPVYNDGWLLANGADVVLELGDETLTDYTVEFDYGIGYNAIYVNMGPNTRYWMYHSGAVYCFWQRFEGNKWVDRAGPPQCPGDRGRLKVRVANNKATVFFNGTKISETVFENYGAHGPFELTLNHRVFIDNFQMTVP